MSPPDPFTLFVYGTLMHDGRNHAPLADQRFLGAARTRPLYALVSLGDHPGMVHRAAGRVVEGELYEVSARLLTVLDEIEEAPHYYRLEQVEMEDGRAPVYAYFYQGARDGPLLGEGRWRESHG